MVEIFGFIGFSWVFISFPWVFLGFYWRQAAAARQARQGPSRTGIHFDVKLICRSGCGTPSDVTQEIFLNCA